MHHCIYGTEGRKLSTKYHLLVGLCSSCHRGPEGVHGKNGQHVDLQLKSDAQEAWIQRKVNKGEVRDREHGLAKWIEVFGEDYTILYLTHSTR